MLALICVNGAALAVLFPLALAWWIKLPAVLAVIAQGAITWRRHVSFASPRAVRRLVWVAENRWELSSSDGADRKARLLPAAYIHPFLVVLRFMTEDMRRCAVILPADGLDADCHRRLRVLLRLKNGETPGAD